MAASSVTAEPQASVFRLQALNDAGVRDGTCFVIRQERRGDDTLLLLATSARLFDRESTRRARVFIGDEQIEVDQDAIATPYGNMRDIAVLTVVSKTPTGPPLPAVFDHVPAGTLFLVSGLRADGSPALVAQHVRFCATRRVIGDRATGDLDGCQGAPAIIDSGVFGVVSECGSDRVPEITPLSVSRGFLQRTVPGLGARPSGPGLRMEERDVIGPELALGVGEVRTGEVDVPLKLNAREALVGATARLVSQPPVTLANVTILSLQESRVRLRFTIGGAPVPAPHSTAWPAAQALVVVRVNVVVAPKF
jgi:hypothetical protein